jgi:predicted transcriptional regulator of viral defense system
VSEKRSATVDVLKQLPSPLFTAADAWKLVPHDNMFLFRASRKGYVRRIANRVYWNVLFSVAPPTVEQVACFARQPSYISCEWALNYHGVLLQTPTVCTAITLHPGIGKRNRVAYGGYLIEYSRIAERLYLPDEILRFDGVLMATIEKALVDAVYLRRQVPFADELETDLLDRSKLVRIAAFYPTRVQRAAAGLLAQS